MNTGFKTQTGNAVHGTADPTKCRFIRRAKQLLEVPIPWEELETRDPQAVVAYLATQGLRPCTCFKWLFLEEREPLPWPRPAAAAEWKLAGALDETSIEQIRVGETLYLLCPRCGGDIGTAVQKLLNPLIIAKIMLEGDKESLALACPECKEPIGRSVAQMLLARQRLVQALLGEDFFASVHLEVFIQQINTTSATVLEAMQWAQKRSADPKSAKAPRNLEILLHRLGWWGGEGSTLRELAIAFNLATPERIRHIIKTELRRLRHPHRSRLLLKAWRPPTPAERIKLEAELTTLRGTVAQQGKELASLRERLNRPPGAAAGKALPGTPLEELDLSVRTYNTLRRSGLHTVEEVTAFKPEELLALRNFGEKALAEVREALARRGLHLKGEEP